MVRLFLEALQENMILDTYCHHKHPQSKPWRVLVAAGSILKLSIPAPGSWELAATATVSKARGASVGT